MTLHTPAAYVAARPSRFTRTEYATYNGRRYTIGAQDASGRYHLYRAGEHALVHVQIDVVRYESTT